MSQIDKLLSVRPWTCVCTYFSAEAFVITLFKTIIPALLLATSVVAADKVIIMEDPQKSLNARTELIMTATKTIDVQFFIIEQDYISIASLAMLRDRARNGVKIRMIVDSMHNLMTREMMSAFLDNLDSSTSRNIEIREFNNFNLLKPLCYTHRMHDKSLIIDGKYLIVGDRNVGNSYYNIPEKNGGKELPSYQGVDVLLAGDNAPPAATQYFNQRWNSKDVKPAVLYEYSDSKLDYSYCGNKSGEGDYSVCENKRQAAVRKVKFELERLDKHYNTALSKGSFILKTRPLAQELLTAFETDDIRFIHDDASTRICAGKNTKNNIAKILYEAVEQNTKKELIIISPYIVVTPEMELLIRKLVGNGVAVRILTNSIISNDVSSASAAYLKTRQRLMQIKNNQGENGVKIYEFTSVAAPTLRDAEGIIIKHGKAVATLHAKVVIMDNSKIFIGSYNWDYRSQDLNSEVGVIIGLTGTKTSGPVVDLRNRVSHLLADGKLVRDDGTTDGEYQSKIALSEKEQQDLKVIIDERLEGVEKALRTLSIPILGELYLKQH